MTDEQGAPPPIPQYEPARPASADLSEAERELALKRLEDKQAFRIHLTVYWLVMTLLVVIWLVSSGWGSYFWPIWPMMGWGLGLAIHGASLFWDREPTEQQIDAEVEKIRQRRARGRIED